MWISTGLVASFRSCVLSWFFLWHLVWLSIMQLRHYLFIGTLNPMLNRLANNDPNLGNLLLKTLIHFVTCIDWLWFKAFSLFSLFSDLSIPSSHYRYPTPSPVFFCFSVWLFPSVHVSLSESVHQCFCYDPAVWSSVCSMEWTHHGQTQRKTSGSW